MFYPFGKMDPLEVALITAHLAHLGAPHEIEAAFDMPRYNAARCGGWKIMAWQWVQQPIWSF